MALELLNDLKSFLSQAGSSWFRVNLHVHGKGNSPDAIVDSALAAGISMIAVTDHNTFRFFRPIHNLALRNASIKLRVLPGIEITLNEGAHLIAIFDETFDESQQNAFLGAIGLPLDGTEKHVVKDRTCSDVLREIADRNGITVVPHPFTDAIGLLDGARKIPTKMAWLESGNLGLIQIAPDKVTYIGYDDKAKWQNRYVLAKTPKQVIESTDYSLSPLAPGEAKKPEDIENGATWLKMGNMSTCGLRQVTCEPKTRIAANSPPSQKKNRLLGMTVSGGCFDGLRIQFSSDLTCIIGENHSGKSAVFDFIGFVLSRESILVGTERQSEKETFYRRLNAILQSGSTVNLFLIRDGNPYCLTRSYSPTLDRAGNIVGIQGATSVFRFDSTRDALIPETIAAATFLPEIYPQGHVGLLRRSAQTQLALIDDLAALTADKTSRDLLRDALKDNAALLAQLYESQEEDTGKVGRLDALKTELADLEKSLAETSHQLWESSVVLIQTFRTELESVVDALSGQACVNLLETNKMSEPVIDDKIMAKPELLRALVVAAGDFNRKMKMLFSQIESVTNEFNKTVSSHLQDWDKAYGEHSNDLTRVLRAKGFDSPEQHLQRIRQIKTEIEDIIKKYQPALSTVQKTIGGKEKERDTLLVRYRNSSDGIHTKRINLTASLNIRLGPDIKVSFGSPDALNYLNLLASLCDQVSSKDHKISRREEQLRLIVEKITPRQLSEAIVNKGRFLLSGTTTETSLVEHCGVTVNTQNVLCRLADKIQILHDLQVFEPEPVPQIMVRREGTNTFADLLTQMSPGEQSSAILAIALMAREQPLLIDQPEDELGYSYIVNKIVPKLLEAKAARQMIVISHNANIPVLGDAEWLVKVRNDPVEGRPRCSIDHVGVFEDRKLTTALLDLEGGERAFLFRQYRYAVPQRK